MFRWVPALAAAFALIHAIPAAAAYNITVSNSATSNVSFASGTYIATGNDAVINASDLVSALGTGSVNISTGVLGTQTGNITVAAPIATTDASIISRSLTFSPANAVILGSDVSLSHVDQIYNGSVALSADVQLSGDNVIFNNPVDGAHALTSNATNTVFNSAVGTSTALTSLDVAQAVMLNGSAVTTTGSQVYSGAATLGTNSTLTSVGGGVGFKSTVDGFAAALTVNGVTSSFGAAVGGSAPLSSLTDNATVVLGGSVTTVGSQFFAGAVQLGADAVLSGLDFTFGSSIDGAHGLTLQGSGTATFTGKIGATTPLTGLTVSLPAQLGDAAYTAGAQSWSSIGLTGNAILDPGSGALSVTGAVALGTNSLFVSGGGSIAGIISGTGSLRKIGSGTLTLNAVNTYSGGTQVTGGTLIVNGTIGAVTVDAGSLGGKGTTGAVTAGLNGATLTPGTAGPGTLTTGTLDLNTQSTYSVDLNGAFPAVGYDQLAATGTVGLDAASLTVSVGYTPALGQVFTIVNNLTPNPVLSTFNGLPEGSAIDVGTLRFQISYVGGDGNDVTLTRVVQPTTLALSATPTSSILGDSVTLEATVSGAGGSVVPGGTVTFRDGSTTLGTAPVVAGVAQLTTTALAAGDHALSADFAGTGFGSSTGNTTAHVDPAQSGTGSTGGTGSATDSGSGTGSGGGTGTQTASTGQQQLPSGPVSGTGTGAPKIMISKASVREGNPPKRGHRKVRRHVLVFTVTISRAQSTPLTVSFRTRNGSAKARQDYLARKGTLTFKPGQTALKVRIQVVPDRKREKNETMSLVIGSVSGVGTIRNDD